MDTPWASTTTANSGPFDLHFFSASLRCSSSRSSERRPLEFSFRVVAAVVSVLDDLAFLLFVAVFIYTGCLSVVDVVLIVVLVFVVLVVVIVALVVVIILSLLLLMSPSSSLLSMDFPPRVRSSSSECLRSSPEVALNLLSPSCCLFGFKPWMSAWW